MEDNPFPDTIIADWKFLDSSPRSQCPTCKKSRKYYCYTCCAPLPHLVSGLPVVKLPVKVDIIKHPGETDGKSTAPHAAILAPNDVVIHTYPCIPDYDLEKVVLVFPGEESVTLDDLAATWLATEGLLPGKVDTSPAAAESRPSHALSTFESDDSKVDNLKNDKKSKEISDSGTAPSDQGGDSHKRPQIDTVATGVDNGDQQIEPPHKMMKLLHSCLPFEKVVFIDATWNQTHNIISDERLKNLKKVELRTRNSNFWRTQEGVPKTYLSTIEAIFYFVKDLHTWFIESEYHHEYDNLLFFFTYLYNKIQKGSKGRQSIKSHQR